MNAVAEFYLDSWAASAGIARAVARWTLRSGFQRPPSGWILVSEALQGGGMSPVARGQSFARRARTARVHFSAACVADPVEDRAGPVGEPLKRMVEGRKGKA